MPSVGEDCFGKVGDVDNPTCKWFDVFVAQGHHEGIGIDVVDCGWRERTCKYASCVVTLNFGLTEKRVKTDVEPIFVSDIVGCESKDVACGKVNGRVRVIGDGGDG